MTTERSIACDICIIGAGSAGLSVAAGAAQLGVKTVLIERGTMGGDCLNVGCVPSKALIAAGKAAHEMRQAGRFGITPAEPQVDFAATLAHVAGVIETIAPMDSQERFEGLGVTVIREEARFLDPRTLAAGNWRVTARRFVIATGSRPAIPPIPGLAECPALTNETLFADRPLPGHLLIIGGGPIGVEMAQAHRRLGARVTVLDRSGLLPREDPELAGIVRRVLIEEGVTLMEGAAIGRVESAPGTVAVHYEQDGQEHRTEGDQILVATGRQPVTEGLDLEKAGVAAGAKGIEVGKSLRTGNRRIYAIGDVTGGMQFTHMAGHQAGLVIRSALFRLPVAVDVTKVPRVTYSDPELAAVGLSEAEAHEQQGAAVTVLRSEFAHNDRAMAERATEGLIKVVVGRRGRILGAAIAGRHAGELILPWVLAVTKGMKIGAMANVITPYPTLGEISKRAAGSYFTPKLFSDKTRRLVRFLTKFG